MVNFAGSFITRKTRNFLGLWNFYGSQFSQNIHIPCMCLAEKNMRNTNSFGRWMTGSLNHPNFCSLFEFNEAWDVSTLAWHAWRISVLQLCGGIENFPLSKWKGIVERMSGCGIRFLSRKYFCTDAHFDKCCIRK